MTSEPREPPLNPSDCGVAIIEGSFRYFQKYRAVRRGKHKGLYWIWPLARGERPHLVRAKSIRRFPQSPGQLRLF